MGFMVLGFLRVGSECIIIVCNHHASEKLYATFINPTPMKKTLSVRDIQNLHANDSCSSLRAPSLVTEGCTDRNLHHHILWYIIWLQDCTSG